MRHCKLCNKELKEGERIICSQCRIKEQRRLWEKVKWRQNSPFLDDTLSPLILRGVKK